MNASIWNMGKKAYRECDNAIIHHHEILKDSF